MNLITATKNKGKIREFKEIFQDTGIRVISIIEINHNLDVVEDLDTFEGNVLKKARYITESPRCENGFAYNELFQVKNTNLTFAEMDNIQRQKYSHRKKAIANFMPYDCYKENFETVLSAIV